MVSAMLFALSVMSSTGTGEKITAENIAIGKLGRIDGLTVIEPLNDTDLAAHFGGLKVLVADYNAKGVGKGKVLPKDQVWRVTGILKSDTSGNHLADCYIIVPSIAKPIPKRGPPAKKKP